MQEDVQIEFQLHPAQALALAQFVKRVGWSEMRENAVSDDEACEMKSALGELQKALADAGFAPR